MTGGEMRSGTATYGYPRRRTVEYESVPTVHQPCGTDREREQCPPECPPETREETR